jgi:hypothetical protein
VRFFSPIRFSLGFMHCSFVVGGVVGVGCAILLFVVRSLGIIFAGYSTAES